MMITSKSNALIKHIRLLKEKKYRKEFGEFFVEGEKMVRESTTSGIERVATIVSASYEGETFSLPVETVSDEVFASVTDEKTPQGILTVLRIPRRELVSPKESCLLLDHIADPGNMGAIVRTANAAGYRSVYCIGCTDPFAPKSVRSSMSGIFFTRLYFGSEEEILGAIDCPIVAGDMHGEDLFSFRAPERYALAIGNEANGLSDTVRLAAAHTVAIPMERSQESLNAAVSAGIIMYTLKYGKE